MKWQIVMTGAACFSER